MAHPLTLKLNPGSLIGKPGCFLPDTPDTEVHMKLVLLPFCLCLLTVCACAKDAAIALQDVPKPVMDALRKEYPENKLVGTGMRTVDGKPKYYDLEIQWSGKATIDVYIDAEGAIIATGTSIALRRIPAAVIAAVQAKYPGWKMSEFEREVNFKTKAVFFSIDVSKDGKSFEVEIDATGTILKEEPNAVEK